MAGDRIRSAKPEALAARMKAAGERGDRYKALYFARLLTDRRPDLAAAWSNRATLAASLGFREEATSAQRNATSPSQPVQIPPEALPGAFSYRPNSLEDWAAAMSLLSDDTGRLEGSGSLVAVRDSVSGIEVNRDQDGGPNAYARPLRLEDLTRNLFVLREARAMSEKKIGSGWALAGAILMGVTAGLNTNMGDVTGAANANRLSGDLMSQAFATDSRYKKGSYVMRTFEGGRATDTLAHPRPAGQFSAVEIPLPILWASGGSLNPLLSVRLVDQAGSAAKTEAIRVRDGKVKRGAFRIPDLSVPRLGTLCLSETCSVPATAAEIMLDSADLDALESEVGRREEIRRYQINWEDFGRAYREKSEHLTIGAPALQVGFAKDGVCYAFGSSPLAWLSSLVERK